MSNVRKATALLRAAFEFLDSDEFENVEEIGQEEEETELNSEDEQLIRDYKNGFSWVKLVSRNALKREGKLMMHDVADYYPKVASEKYEVYSLRDPSNKPHCTIGVDLKKRAIDQIVGKRNEPLDLKYVGYVWNFIKYPLNNGPKYRSVVDIPE